MQEVIEALNKAQQEAVRHIDGPLLILAGAGSGKTKTLTTRLAYLISEVGIDPLNTLTLTFTNKAASEMRERASKLVPAYSSMPLLCTFHKFGLLFLKFNIEKLGRANNFVIIDTDDRKRILKRIAKEHSIDLNIAFVSSEISKYKNTLLTADEILKKAELPDYRKIATIYKDYQAEITENNLVDFDDLLMLTYQILEQDEVLRKETSNRYQYIMVDEYQDTNELQFKLLELLSSEHNNLCVVGDDDQSIYGWRGANIRNILEFSERFKGTKTVKLETNYRSTSPILKAANELIEHNSQRIGKKLTSFKGDGDSVKLFHSLDESLESKGIAREIKVLLDRGVSSDEIAVLYRINALSRSLEEGFTKEGLPFKLLGGMRFYDRAEIKDMISYFRVLSNPNDDFSIERIINKPKRAIGKVTVDKLKKAAFDNQCSIFKFIKEHDLGTVVSKKAANSLKEFVQHIELLQSEIHHSLHNFIELFEDTIGMKKYYAAMVDGNERVQNIDEFIGYFREAITNTPDLALDVFLNDISLQSDQDNIDENAITIMSIHASKGLEFEHLYVIGLEEEFFPLLGDGCNMEEERRLGYVAITRAKSDLTLCYVDSRFYKGQRKRIDKSRFLGEAGLIQGEALKISKVASYKIGDLVKHKIFGIGRVQAANKSGQEYKLKINFGGNKKEILSSFVQSV
ncbi:MAG: ATP-dependent DNA helicase UvrD/PcrA/Rep, epsilon proteobacterial type 2 [uncultured Sulfurovum sp.]|uniref:DNA 3'-5' helicase n=1 Tax=uncultured Sulfurovum sp. TaxID=269237 RepID=A0A6S6S3J0_9BACT|nr:MAG: ATP-dependent DNA helicase UvrD/PcrA/Rep, epsilon proteobacterial type 2 [uncultured Sulfurovum sp.]